MARRRDVVGDITRYISQHAITTLAAADAGPGFLFSMHVMLT